MATTTELKVISLPAGEDLTGDGNELLTINAAGNVIKAAAVTSHVIGVLASNPGTTAAGDIVPVALIGGGGLGKVKASAAITRGHIVVPTATAGKAAGVANIAALAANQMGIGVALQAATAANEVIEVLFQTIVGPNA